MLTRGHLLPAFPPHRRDVSRFRYHGQHQRLLNEFTVINSYIQHLGPITCKNRLKAVCDDDRMIGFLVYGLDPDDGRHWLITFMIDERYQGMGYGKQAMAAFLDYFKAHYDADRIVLGHRPDNAAAAALYEKAGFRETGEIIGGEVIRCHTFSR